MPPAVSTTPHTRCSHAGRVASRSYAIVIAIVSTRKARDAETIVTSSPIPISDRWVSGASRVFCT